MVLSQNNVLRYYEEHNMIDFRLRLKMYTVTI